MVDHPTAFCLLTPYSFVYAPGAEQHVFHRCLIFDPCIFLGMRFDSYRCDHPTRDEFLKGKEVAMLQDFEAKDFPFQSNALHWRPAGVIERSGCIPWDGYSIV